MESSAGEQPPGSHLYVSFCFQLLELPAAHNLRTGASEVAVLIQKHLSTFQAAFYHQVSFSMKSQRHVKLHYALRDKLSYVAGGVFGSFVGRGKHRTFTVLQRQSTWISCQEQVSLKLLEQHALLNTHCLLLSVQTVDFAARYPGRRFDSSKAEDGKVRPRPMALRSSANPDPQNFWAKLHSDATSGQKYVA